MVGETDRPRPVPERRPPASRVAGRGFDAPTPVGSPVPAGVVADASGPDHPLATDTPAGRRPTRRPATEAPAGADERPSARSTPLLEDTATDHAGHILPSAVSEGTFGGKQ